MNEGYPWYIPTGYRYMPGMGRYSYLVLACIGTLYVLPNTSITQGDLFAIRK